MKTKLTLVLELEYEVPSKREKALPRKCLNALVEHAANEGLFSDEGGFLEVTTWDYRIIEGSPTVLVSAQKEALVKLLDYGQEAEEKHYWEMKETEGANSPAAKSHIWHTIKRLAKAIGHAF